VRFHKKLPAIEKHGKSQPFKGSSARPPRAWQKSRVKRGFLLTMVVTKNTTDE
jgi:hypothetical protein